MAGPFDEKDVADHFVPADKKLKPEWIDALTAKGERTVYRGKDLERIGMPIGGICAGQLYLAGDGRLVHWDIFNQTHFSGYGANNYEGRQARLAAGAGLRRARAVDGGKTVVRTLDVRGLPRRASSAASIRSARVEYADAEVPVAVTLEAFSPFIPLNAADSAPAGHRDAVHGEEHVEPSRPR